ncbi:hypothetical protein Syun_010055 [Stephania yunnanensis]|uniref:Uncharacterized protein n=1 Tax=Stephania yunnanensis TaxID=152371 RepID=A0AAP0KFQ1_9MAGN
MTSNQVIKEALSKLLVYYPHFAGPFIIDDRGRTCIALNNAGIRVIETRLSTTLSEQLPFDPSKEANHLLPPDKGIKKFLQVQLNHYAYDGLIIELTFHHRVFDGHSISIPWQGLTSFDLGVDPGQSTLGLILGCFLLELRKWLNIYYKERWSLLGAAWAR